MIWKQNGTYEWFCYGNDSEPVYQGTFKIEKAWRDREGNIRCIVWRSFRGNSWTLTKISDNGNVSEYIRRVNRDHLPTEIDPDDDWYFKDIGRKTSKFFPSEIIPVLLERKIRI